ncbi:MAG: Flp pilus assembly protein CpaB [Planctomycetota bacterium]
MRGKSLALLVLSLGCGIVAALGITQVLAKRGDSPAPSDTTPLYVAKADIAVGSVLTQESVKLEQWPKDRVPTGAVIRQEDVDGRRTRQKIYAGEPIIEPKLLTHGQVPIDGLVPKGLRVVPVPVSSEAIHSGLVLPGSRCDVQVFIRADPSIGVGETLCKTILQDVRVFAVNDVTSTESQDPKAPETKSMPLGKTVSLLVTPAQAQIVTLASQLGSIRLILRSAEDSEQPKTTVMTAQEMLGTSGGGNRGKENSTDANEKRFQDWAETIRKTMRENTIAQPTGTRASEGQSYTMRVRSGAEVNDVLLVKNSEVRGLPGDEGAWTATGMNPSLRTKPNDPTQGLKPAEGGSASPTPPHGIPTMPLKSGAPNSPQSPPESSRSGI